jgi:putative ABC transport system substrate-binding protein
MARISMRIRLVMIVYLFLAAVPPPCSGASPTARVAFLGTEPPTDPIAERTWRGFTEGLQALGWTAGRNVTFTRRWSEGRDERATALAAELAAEQPDVIVAVGYPNAKAVQQRVKTIPMVFINVPDPVGLGLVASLARPGGNITGTSNQAEDFIGKALQLLNETRPGISRMAYLGYGESTYWKLTEQHAATAARQLGLDLAMIPIKSPADFDAVFGEIRRARSDALVVSGLPIFRENSQKIASFAIEHRLPTFTFNLSMAQDGFLLAQSTDVFEMFRPAAAIVDKILKGTKPADIPVEQPTRFRFVVNLKTARAIGIEIPPVLLANADELIE